METRCAAEKALVDAENGDQDSEGQRAQQREERPGGLRPAAHDRREQELKQRGMMLEEVAVGDEPLADVPRAVQKLQLVPLVPVAQSTREPEKHEATGARGRERRGRCVPEPAHG